MHLLLQSLEEFFFPQWLEFEFLTFGLSVIKLLLSEILNRPGAADLRRGGSFEKTISRSQL